MALPDKRGNFSFHTWPLILLMQHSKGLVDVRVAEAIMESTDQPPAEFHWRYRHPQLKPSAQLHADQMPANQGRMKAKHLHFRPNLSTHRVWSEGSEDRFSTCSSSRRGIRILRGERIAILEQASLLEAQVCIKQM